MYRGNKLNVVHLDAHIRVSREELEVANYTSIPFQDGSVRSPIPKSLVVELNSLGVYRTVGFHAPVALFGKADRRSLDRQR